MHMHLVSLLIFLTVTVNSAIYHRDLPVQSNNWNITKSTEFRKIVSMQYIFETGILCSSLAKGLTE